MVAAGTSTDDNPFSAPSSSSLHLPTGPSHKASLSVLIRDAPLPAPGEQQVDLPEVPPLSHELFMGSGEEFDPSEFLLERRHLGLEEMRSELRAYLATLRTSLVAVINEEYEAFIGLSLGLRHASVSTSLASIRRPVLSIRNEVSRVKTELEGMKEEMEGVLGERKAVREKKAMLRRLLEMEDQVEKVEGLLRVGEAKKGRDMDRVVDSPAKRLERIAAEYSQMLYLVSKAGDLPFVRSLDPRIAKVTTTLQLDLSQLLTSILAEPTRETLTSVFRTYASLSLHSTAQDIYRRTVVKPYVSKTIYRDALSTASGPKSPLPKYTQEERERNTPASYLIDEIPSRDGAGPEEDALRVLYNEILGWISRECGLVLDVTEKMGTDEKKKGGRYEILVGVIWEEVAGRLLSELGHVIFAAGRPAVFHQNYVLTTAFISRLESVSPTLAHLNAFRTHPSTVNFLKRFQLPVYFQLRFKEIVSSVERSMESAGNPVPGATFLLGESEGVWKALQACWSDEVFLPELAGRFWRLTLQLISRYRTWLNSVLPKYVLPSSASSANLSALAAGGPSSTRASFDGGRGDRLSASPVPTRPGTPSAQDEVSEETTLRQLTVLIADSRQMEKKVLELFESRIQSRLPGADSNADDSPFAVLQESLALVTSIVPSLSNQVVTILIRRAVDHLKHVRTVATRVRASTRKGPNEPSFFVANLLKDLRAYLTGPGKVIDEETRHKWASAVVDDIATKFAVKLLEQKKTDDSLLRWAKKGRQSLFGGFGGRGATPEEGASEDDKVKMQMRLDISALGKDAATVGVDVGQSQAFAALVQSMEDGKEEEKK
ncbi:component of oligomeric golgi complex 2 [Pseudohyphozyma bogoriensis]|nr:component of oligomeric golgi complex 2 [Pseudohyphozyma bogoriensis]